MLCLSCVVRVGLLDLNRDKDSSARLLSEAIEGRRVDFFQTDYADSCSSIFESLLFAFCSSNRT